MPETLEFCNHCNFDLDLSDPRQVESGYCSKACARADSQFDGFPEEEAAFPLANYGWDD
jgi:hypothetical protein